MTIGGQSGGQLLAKNNAGEGVTAIQCGFFLVAVTVISVSLVLMLDDMQIGGHLIGLSSVIVGALYATRGVGR